MAKINIMAMRHSAFYAPLLMTIKGGYLERQGLEPEYSLATAENTIEDNLRAGTMHLSQSAPAVSFAALERGETLDLVHFACINERDGFYLSAREAMTQFTWRDLEGQDVLVDHLFQPLATLRYAMFLNGADLDRVNVIDAGNVEQMDTAFRAGQGAFVHQQGPAPQQLEKDGQGHLVASVGEAIGPIAFSSLYASRQWLKTDMARAFLAAYEQAMNDISEMSSAQIANVIHDFLPGIDKEVLITTLEGYKKLNTWNTDISIKTESYENLLKVFLHSGMIKTAHPMQNCIVQPLL